MRGFFSSLHNLWKEACDRRRYAHIIAPKHIEKAAQELQHLLHLALSNGFFSSEEAYQLQKLQREMENLITLTQKAAFRRLPATRRVILHESLLRSHEKLLISLQGTQSPTMRMQ